MQTRRMETKSVCTPAETTNLPMSDLPILRSVISLVSNGLAVPESTTERQRLKGTLGCIGMLRKGVRKEAMTKVVRTPV